MTNPTSSHAEAGQDPAEPVPENGSAPSAAASPTPRAKGAHAASGSEATMNDVAAASEETPAEEAPADDAATAAAAAAAAKRAKAETIGRYVAMFLMPLLMVGMMIWGYLFAMHSPTPHQLPIAVVGQSAAAQDLLRSAESTQGEAVKMSTVDTVDEARQMVLDRKIAGAVSVDGKNATLYTASSAGASQVSIVAGLIAPEAVEQGLTLTTEDLAPLPKGDPAGLGAMFMATALVMAGYLPLSITLSNAPQLMRKRRFIPLLAAWSALIAGIVWLVTGPILDVLAPEHGWAVFGIAALGVFAIGCVQLFFTRIMGPMAVLAGMFLLMVLGVPSSNMGISVFTAPPFYQVLHSFLPTPAIGEALRSVMYFNGAGAWPHLMVLLIGAVAGLALTFLIDGAKKRKNPNPGPVLVNMPSLHGGKRPKSRFWRYLSLLAFPLLMVVLMISAMLGAMHSPTPRDMPVAVVGATVEQAQQSADGLNTSMPGMFDFRVTDNAAQARQDVADRDVVGAFVLPSQASPEATVITNSAAGTGASQVVDRVFTQVAQAQKMPVSTDDVAPLPESDSAGVVSMYVAMGWIMAGFMIVVVGANAAPASRPLPKLVPIVAVYAVAMSAFIWLIAAPFTGSLEGHFWQLLGTGAVAIFSVAMFATVFERLIGLFAIIPVVGILMFLGVPASGGALSVYMEPEFFLGLHPVLPMSAGVEAVRSILYFGSDTLGVSLLTFLAWGAASLIVVVIIDRFKGVRTTTEYVTVPAQGPTSPAPVSDEAEAGAVAGSSYDVAGGTGSEKELVNA